MDEAKILGMLKLNPIAIKNIDNPTDEMKIMALKRDGLLLRYIDNATKEMEEIAVKTNPRAIEFIDNPTEELMKEAVLAGWSNLNYIKKPSYDVLKLAIEQRGWAIQYVKEPIEELQIMAVKKDYDSITDKKKKNMFDTDNLFNPYADTRILNIAEDKEIKNIFCGIDMQTAELILADRLNEKNANIDLVITHHPNGYAYNLKK